MGGEGRSPLYSSASWNTSSSPSAVSSSLMSDSLASAEETGEERVEEGREGGMVRVEEGVDLRWVVTWRSEAGTGVSGWVVIACMVRSVAKASERVKGW